MGRVVSRGGLQFKDLSITSRIRIKIAQFQFQKYEHFNPPASQFYSPQIL
jgi:hypothetical protein